MEAQDYIQRLNEINKKKLALLEELLLCSRSQKELMQAGRYDEMEALLARKQLRMDAVDKLDEQFNVYAARLKANLNAGSFEDLPRFGIPGTQELKACVLKIHQKLGEIKAQDDENTALIRAEMKDTRERINHSNAFKRATGAYYPVQSNDVPPVYFDKKK